MANTNSEITYEELDKIPQNIDSKSNNIKHDLCSICLDKYKYIEYDLCSICLDEYKYIEYDLCSICLDKYSDNDNDNVRILNECNHKFHKNCIDYWLKDKYTCPCCRNKVKYNPTILKYSNDNNNILKYCYNIFIIILSLLIIIITNNYNYHFK